MLIYIPMRTTLLLNSQIDRGIKTEERGRERKSEKQGDLPGIFFTKTEIKSVFVVFCYTSPLLFTLQGIFLNIKAL